MMPLAAFAIKFGSGLPAGRLLVDGGADNTFAALAIKFGGGFPAGMMMADGGSDNAFGGRRHQVWQRASCGDAAS